MTYSKLNGCGYITFYLNDEEAEAQRIKNEQEQRTKKQERMIKRKANPERRAQSIERLKREIEETNHSIQYFLEELSEEDITPEDKKLTRKVLKVKRNELKELEADLNFYLS